MDPLAPLSVALLSAIRRTRTTPRDGARGRGLNAVYSSLTVTIIAACVSAGMVAMGWRKCGLLALSACGFGLGIYSMTESLRLTPPVSSRP